MLSLSYFDVLDKNFNLFHLKQYFMNFDRSSHRKCSVKKGVVNKKL